MENEKMLLAHFQQNQKTIKGLRVPQAKQERGGGRMERKEKSNVLCSPSQVPGEMKNTKQKAGTSWVSRERHSLPHGGRGKPIPARCPPTSTFMTYTYMHTTYTYTDAQTYK